MLLPYNRRQILFCIFFKLIGWKYCLIIEKLTFIETSKEIEILFRKLKIRKSDWVGHMKKAEKGSSFGFRLILRKSHVVRTKDLGANRNFKETRILFYLLYYYLIYITVKLKA